MKELLLCWFWIFNRLQVPERLVCKTSAQKPAAVVKGPEEKKEIKKKKKTLASEYLISPLDQFEPVQQLQTVHRQRQWTVGFNLRISFFSSRTHWKKKEEYSRN